MLIRDSNTLQQYAQVTGNPDYEALKASLRMVEDKYIKPIIGKDLYLALDESISGATEQDPLAASLADLLDACCRAIGPLFCYFHADKSDVKFGDQGMQRVESTTFKSAFQEQRTKFKEANLAEGEDALELLIQFLEENPQDYSEWTDSDEFKQYRALFIRSGLEFQKYFPSAAPHRNYRAIRQIMETVEESDIRPLLGDTLFNALKEKQAEIEPPTSEFEKKLIEKLCRAIANLTVAFAMPLLNVRISSNGLTIPAVQTFSQNEDQNTRAGIDEKMYSTYRSTVLATAQTWLKNAVDYIKANKDEFPDWIGFTTTEENTCDKPLNTIFGL